MRAIVCPRYGGPDVLELREVERPSPKDDEVCIRIMATAVTASDIFIRGSDIPLRFRIPMRLMLGVTRPRKPIIGLVLAGEIASVGRRTTRFKPGDQVYGLTGLRARRLCRVQVHEGDRLEAGVPDAEAGEPDLRGSDRSGLRRAPGPAVHGEGRHPARPESTRSTGHRGLQARRRCSLRSISARRSPGSAARPIWNWCGLSARTPSSTTPGSTLSSPATGTTSCSTPSARRRRPG